MADTDDSAASDEPGSKPDAKADKVAPATSTETGRGSVNKRWILFAVVFVLSLVADQASKIWARDSLETHRNQSMDHSYTRTGACEIPEDLIPRESPDIKSSKGDATMWAPCSAKNEPVIESFWHWRLSMNPGSAFGLFAGDQPKARIFLSIVGLIAVGGMLWMLRKSRPDQRILHWALALVAGGAVGNLIDRIYYGYVTDFILWHVGDYHGSPDGLGRYQHEWPVFNIADVVLVVGVGLMFIDIQKEGKREKLKGRARDDTARKAGLVKNLRD